MQRTVSFPLSGPEETPGVITLSAGDGTVVIFNATPQTRQQRIGALAGTAYTLHPIQAKGADSTVKSASYEKGSGIFTVPGRTVAVYSRSAP